MTLTPSQLTSLGKTLDAQYVALLEEVRGELGTPERQHYLDLLDRGPGDSGDAAVGATLAGMHLTIIDRHVRDLRDIEAAMARLKDDSLGDCVDCGGEIDFARMQAYPTAKRCLVCQQQHEKTYAAEGVNAP